MCFALQCWKLSIWFYQSSIVVPSFIIAIFGYVWYRWEYKKECRKNIHLPEVKTINTHYSRRILLTVMGLGLLNRYLEMLYYGFRYIKLEIRERNILQKRLMHISTRVRLLRLFECFLEAAPQLLLQLYFIITEGKTKGELLGQVICCVLSLLSIAKNLENYN